MLKRYCCRVLLLSLLSPTVSLALGLGDIHLNSALNARLDADIDVVGASAEDLAGLSATLASREAFTRSGDDYPSFLGALTLTPRRTADGRDVIHVTSANPASEPFATLLVDVNWPRGHLLREYTVLLDPPVFSSQAASNAAVAAPTVDTAARSGAVQRVSAAAEPAAASQNAGAAAVAATPVAAAPVAAPTTPSTRPAPTAALPRRAAPAAPAAPSSAAPASSYTVKPGDTLYAIAGQAYPQADRSARPSELVAIYRANPSAFGGNMNLVRSGSHLRLPGDAEVAAISPGEASAEVHRQYSAWNSGHGAPAAASNGAGQLRLVPPQEGAPTAASGTGTAGAAGAAAANSGNTAALEQRVQQLQTQLQDTQRLLQMRSAELAALQARGAQSANTPAAPAPPPAAPATSAAPSAPPPSPTPSAAPPAPPTVAAPAEKPTTPSAATANESGNSMLDLIKEYWYVPAALVVVLIVLMIVRVVRARQEDEFDRSLGRLTQPAVDPAIALRSSETQPVRTVPAPRDEPSYRVEESGLQHVLEPPPAAERAGATAHNVAIDSSVTGQTPVALDQGDPLAETDFHMAYGLYEQAVDLVQTAIAREPHRRDLKLKLLEVFFVWGNHDRFVQSAHELAESRDKALPGEWEKIVIMGRQIAPEDSLFASPGALTGAASGGVDLNLEGGQNRVDFDLLGEPSSVNSPDVGVDLDLGAALGETALTDSDPTGEPHRFVRGDSTGSTREMPAQGAPDSPTRRSPEAEIPTVEQPHLRGGEDNSTIQQKIDLAARAGMVSSEQTAELALDDLGLDLGELEHTVDEPVALDKTVENRKAAGGVELTPSTSGTWMFNDTDFVSVISEEGGEKTEIAPSVSEDSMTVMMTQVGPKPPADSSATSQMPTLESAGMDLGDLGDLHAPEAGANGLDLDVGTAAVGEGTYLQTQKIRAEDMAMPELEPATMSEVGTKLDLARAYMDMGDPEGARSILAEVLSEGSVSQKQEARRLMDTLPG